MAKSHPLNANLFCSRENLTNEASVENWFVDNLLKHLGYDENDIRVKESIRELRVGQGSKTSLYKPDYIISIDAFPVIVVDAKGPEEDLLKWTGQCGSYCLEINKQYEFNPVEYYVLSNGLRTLVYRWDQGKPLIDISFSDFVKGSPLLVACEELLRKNAVRELSRRSREALQDTPFRFERITSEELSGLFSRLHQFIWEKEKKTPAAAFEELMKIVFIKIKKDGELHRAIGDLAKSRTRDVVFSAAWIQTQTENQNPINDPLFKNLVAELEKEIRDDDKRRIFLPNENINLGPATILHVVRELEHKDFFSLEEDVHGRMFESFLDATVRGPDLGQFFTPRDIVELMVKMADISVAKDRVDLVLDACCGSGGFLISAMNEMKAKARAIPGLTNKEQEALVRKITHGSLIGIDAGSAPAIYRLARMNMYLHGDGGSNIYFADSLDKRVGQVGKGDLELDAELRDLRTLLIEEKARFDVILSNPPFSQKYSRKDPVQEEVLNQYQIGSERQAVQSLPSSVMFLERYRELVKPEGRVFAIVDESILSGENYKDVRDYIRAHFVIIAVVSLPGDAFKRSDARVKTSILVLRPKAEGENQGELFMTSSVYIGLTAKVARRIGISEKELAREKPKEVVRILKDFVSFGHGKRGAYVVRPSQIADRLDVKYCIQDTGRRRGLWKRNKLKVVPLTQCLREVEGRDAAVLDGVEYSLLKVTYDGDVVESERKFGEECSYRVLYRVKEWDVLFSNMGVGRGAIGIVPSYCAGQYVSSEYTILSADSHEEAFYYVSILRTKEILGDILASATGMNRGRLKWQDMGTIEVPAYDKKVTSVGKAATLLEDVWLAHDRFQALSSERLKGLSAKMKLEGADSRLRWLANKPPE